MPCFMEGLSCYSFYFTAGSGLVYNRHSMNVWRINERTYNTKSSRGVKTEVNSLSEEEDPASCGWRL